MSVHDPEPTPDQLLAMAYVDGELDDAGRREFEERMAGSVELQREVAKQQRVAVLARQVGPPEPMDYEWERLGRDGIHRAGLGLGFAALFVGGLIGIGSLAYWIAFGPLPLWEKVLAGACLGGGLLLFLSVLRARMRTLPYDPYTEVKR